MKPKDIIIATALILTLSNFLTGCQLIESNDEVTTKPAAEESMKKEVKKPRIPQRAQELIEKAKEVKKEVKMTFETEEKEGQIEVSIYLENTAEKAITSVQAWLSFNPELIEGVKMKASDSAFTLPAPYKNGFDNESGLMMLGRSNPDVLTDTKIFIAMAVKKTPAII